MAKSKIDGIRINAKFDSLIKYLFSFLRKIVNEMIRIVIPASPI
jgi:hypothetical protein